MFNKEESDSWTTVGKPPQSNNKSSYAEVVKQGILTGANSIPLRRSAFDRLEFPK
jgi:hypothetical protein